MFGNIINVHEYTIVVENLLRKVAASFLGVHVIFEDNHKLVGEISKMTDKEIECTLIGEIENNVFITGLTHKPSVNTRIRVISKEEVILLVGKQNVDSPDSIYLGKSVIYEGVNVSANINRFF